MDRVNVIGCGDCMVGVVVVAFDEGVELLEVICFGMGVVADNFGQVFMGCFDREWVVLFAE